MLKQQLKRRRQPSTDAPPPRPPSRPSPRSAPEAQALLTHEMLRVPEKHDDPAMRAAGERPAKAAKVKNPD